MNPNIFKQNLTFLDVFWRISLEQKQMPNELKDKYGEQVNNPTQQQKVENRVCYVCGMYLSAVKMHECVQDRRSSTRTNVVFTS